MRGAISRLLLGARKGKSLVYVGGVGTGFSHKMARDLKMRLEAIPVTKPPVALKRKMRCSPGPNTSLKSNIGLGQTMASCATLRSRGFARLPTMPIFSR
ncbi:hypothetical protein DEA98_29295 (plasmid) [Brucella pseudogrignonensis]|nr:hypothetical protein [Brucella pseudogrignonensis]